MLGGIAAGASGHGFWSHCQHCLRRWRQWGWSPPFLHDGTISTPDSAFFRALAEGVLQAEKDFNKPKHSDELDVPNLQVIKLMQSFVSRELVTERFAWRHFYWCALGHWGSMQNACMGAAWGGGMLPAPWGVRLPDAPWGVRLARADV